MGITYKHFGPRVNAIDSTTQRLIETLSIGQASEVWEALGVEITEAKRVERIEAEENREKFSLELGIDTPDAGRVCAVKAGPFDTSEEAVSFAMFAKGQSPYVIEHANDNVEWYDLDSHSDGAQLPIVGATLNIHTDRGGTVRNIDLY